MLAAVSTAEELRAAVGAVPDGPVVRIRYRPGVCATELQELFAPGEVTPDGVAGVDPDDVVKAICRAIDCGPGALVFEADPAARHLRGDAARCYLVAEAGGERRAHVVGISFAWLTVSVSRLLNSDWRPGRNREAGRVGSGDPAGSPNAADQTAAYSGPFPARAGQGAAR